MPLILCFARESYLNANFGKERKEQFSLGFTFKH